MICEANSSRFQHLQQLVLMTVEISEKALQKNSTNRPQRIWLMQVIAKRMIAHLAL